MCLFMTHQRRKEKRTDAQILETRRIEERKDVQVKMNIFFAMYGSLKGVVGKCLLRVLEEWCNKTLMVKTGRNVQFAHQHSAAWVPVPSFFLGQTRGCNHVSFGSLCCGSMASEVEDGHDWDGEPQWTAGQFLPSADLTVTWMELIH